jgi:hypothetical protein
MSRLMGACRHSAILTSMWDLEDLGNCAYVDYNHDVEVGMIDVNGVVMSDKGVNKSRKLEVDMQTNGWESSDMEAKSWCKQPMR